MRLKIDKKLKIAGLNSKFTNSRKEKCTSICSLLKIFKNLKLLLTFKFTHQQPQERFKSFKKLYCKKAFLF